MSTLKPAENGKITVNEQSIIGRRQFLQRVSVIGAGSLLALGGMSRWASLAQAADEEKPAATPIDTAQEIFTAALIAEGLATTMYYNALIGGVIMDPNLAGSGGSATNVEPSGSLANVGYLQAALSEEIQHADLLRSLIGGTSPATDPIQTFYFPTGTFDTLENFLPVLLGLESAFIGAYLTAVEEFSLMAAHQKPFTHSQLDPMKMRYKPDDLAYYAKVAASIMGVEAQHLALGWAIPAISTGNTTFASINVFPADNQNYMQTDGLTSVYNGSGSAVTALTPYVTSGSGTTAFSYATAIANASTVSTPTTGTIPPSIES